MQNQSPEPSTGERLRAIRVQQSSIREQLTTLHQTDSDGREYDIKLTTSQWSVIPGRPGVMLFAIPHPLGQPGLWMAAFYVSPNSEYTGSHIAERRLVTVLEGELDCNGRLYGPGQSLTIAPHESTTWKVVAGAAGVTLYDTPAPNETV
jgi:hypothetical protein